LKTFLNSKDSPLGGNSEKKEDVDIYTKALEGVKFKLGEE
jgi:hypothetical protein